MTPIFIVFLWYCRRWWKGITDEKNQEGEGAPSGGNNGEKTATTG